MLVRLWFYKLEASDWCPSTSDSEQCLLAGWQCSKATFSVFTALAERLIQVSRSWREINSALTLLLTPVSFFPDDPVARHFRRNRRPSLWTANQTVSDITGHIPPAACFGALKVTDVSFYSLCYVNRRGCVTNRQRCKHSFYNDKEDYVSPLACTRFSASVCDHVLVWATAELFSRAFPYPCWS